MKMNLGSVDRVVRIIIALVLGWLYFTNRVTGTLGIVLLVVAAALFVTALVGFCPAYLAFGLSTKKRSPPPAA